MSSTTRSPDEKSKPDAPDEPEKKRLASPGRYSLADDGDHLPPTRIDSTPRMPALRIEAAPRSRPDPARAPAAPPSNPLSQPPSITRDKKPPIGLPTRGQPYATHGTQRAMPAPLAKGAAPTGDRLCPAVETAGMAAKGASVLAESQTTAKTEAPAAEARSARKPDVAPVTCRSAGAPEEKPEEKVEARTEPKPEPVKEAAATAPSSAQAPSEARAPSSRPRPPSIAPTPRRTSSLRPPSNNGAPQPDSKPPAFDGFDEGSVAFAFDALLSEGPVGQPGTHEFDLTPVRELFAELAANHMRHVRDFMIDVKWGEVTRDWINICVPPVRTLRLAAERLELLELAKALERLGAELDAANAVGGQMLDADEKRRLLEAYDELVKILPQAFALDRYKTQREAVIVQALLLQVPDVRKVTIDKMHAAGLTSLSVLFEASASEISQVAGIPYNLAARIVDRVQAYRAELKTASPQDARAAEREKLAALNATLKEHHEAYEAAANGWTSEAKAKKRDHFRAREETWLEISVLLARFGEVDRLQGIEKVPFAQRIAELTAYLEEAREKYRAAEG
jgi:hypothetical protein